MHDWWEWCWCTYLQFMCMCFCQECAHTRHLNSLMVCGLTKHTHDLCPFYFAMSSLCTNSPETQKTHKTLEVTQPADWTRMDAAPVCVKGWGCFGWGRYETNDKKTHIGNREMQRMLAVLCDNRWIAAETFNFLCESKTERKKNQEEIWKKKSEAQWSMGRRWNQRQPEAAVMRMHESERDRERLGEGVKGGRQREGEMKPLFICDWQFPSDCISASSSAESTWKSLLQLLEGEFLCRKLWSFSALPLFHALLWAASLAVIMCVHMCTQTLIHHIKASEWGKKLNPNWKLKLSCRGLYMDVCVCSCGCACVCVVVRACACVCVCVLVLVRFTPERLSSLGSKATGVQCVCFYTLLLPNNWRHVFYKPLSFPHICAFSSSWSSSSCSLFPPSFCSSYLFGKALPACRSSFSTSVALKDFKE